MKLLTAITPFAHAATLVNAGLLSVILWPEVSRPALLMWLSGVILITGLRHALIQHESPDWDTRFIIATGVSGVAWGAGGGVLFTPQSLVHQVFLAFAIGGMAAGAIPVLSPIFRAYVVFTVPVLLPMTVQFLAQGDEVHVSMGVMGGVYLIVMLATAWRIRDMVMTSLQLRFEKNELVEHLTSEIAERKSAEAALHQAHQDLDRKIRERTMELVHANEGLNAQIVERELVEQALRGGQELFRLIMDNIVDMINVADAEGKRVYNNRAYRALLGDADSVYGTDSFQAIHPDDRERMKGVFAKTIETGVGQHAEYRLVSRNRGVRVVESIGNVIRNQAGAVVDVIVVSRDVTERKRAEEKIRQQAALLEVARDAILVVDLKGRILFWNQWATRMYGWTAEETVEKTSEQILYRHVPLLWQNAMHTLMTQGQWRGEVNQLTKHGKEIVVESHWTLVKEENGTASSILKVNSDITDKKLLEKQFLQGQRLESLGTLAGGIAHDINNVLTPILLAAQLLRMKVDDDESRQWIAGIEASARRGANMVRQVLFFARGVDGERVPLVVKYLLTELTNILKETFPRSIEIHTSLADELWIIVGDFTQIYQMLLNLCVNARDAMPDSGRLDVQAENAMIDENAARKHGQVVPGPYVALSVQDTGAGISPDAMERIFDPFFTTKEISEGTGLGLSTALGIVKSHGGFIAVDSAVGKGTRLTVYIRAEHADDSPGSIDTLSMAPKGHGEVVLIVDDEAAVLEVTKSTLEAHGYQVLTATDGSKAVDLYARHQERIDVVVTDIMMPTMGGEAMMGALRNLNPAVKLIAVSGLMENPKLLDWPYERIPVLTKPYSTDRLLIRLRQVLTDAGP